MRLDMYRRNSLWILMTCAVASSVLVCSGANADPVAGEVFPLRQPDGTTIDVRIWGDEFYHVVESLDGYTLVHDPQTGAGCYARLSRDGGELVSTGVPVGSPMRASLKLKPHVRISRASAEAKIARARGRVAEAEAEVLSAVAGTSRFAPPNLGNVRGIVLLVDFSDQPGTIPPSEINSYCNQIGYTGYGNNGSVRDYFHDVSDGNLTYTNFVPETYYRATYPKSWYDDRNVPCCSRAQQLVRDALEDLDDQGFDFSKYDSNSDGLVDAVNVFYAGTRNGPWAYGLWPHSSWISFSADGVSTGRYQITDIGTSLSLGTFCHENGHMICYWPDLYDYGYESSGVGNFCLMCYGGANTNPVEPCAYMKYIAGWSATTLLTTPQSNLPVPAGTNEVYKYEHPTATNEYYLIENRQRSGRDASLPDHGLAIWHVDTFGSNDYEHMTPEYHYLCTLVQADGDWDLENGIGYGDSTDLWAAPYYSMCTPETYPSTNWWDGSESTLFITDISASGPAMTFDFRNSWDCNKNGIPDEEDIALGTSADDNANGVPDECECPTLSDAPVVETPVVASNRYLSFMPGNPGQPVAIRVTLTDLPNGLEALEGTQLWVGEPVELTENSGLLDPAEAPDWPTLWAATLQCDPHFMDWGAYDMIHVYDETIVPNGMYEVQAVNETCDLVPESNYSAKLVVGTSAWGDVCDQWNGTAWDPPNGQIDLVYDVTAILDKYKNVEGALIKARADIEPALPDQKVNMTDVTFALDAFSGLSYPFATPDPCP